MSSGESFRDMTANTKSVTLVMCVHTGYSENCLCAALVVICVSV